ncbi:Protein of unknown function [Colwellia chukchiensis]|uniref:Tll0287-like domain-containing protein n=1 Tax=Colwellia chukchiensis TaxID=641665 RepID=A0A1H7REV3_9GAMM|nr:DUF3365 domain-containing protein [Colwellia chukchiensis]SEL57927.1 Protein of unknown function [Colwellia chukchiensis]
MMQSSQFFLAIILVLFSSPVFATNVQSDTDLNLQAKQLVKRFAGALKPQLMQGIQSGGLVHAINVCAQTAPRIANELSTSSGWQVKRVSLKPRNAKAKPDDFERAVLERFNVRQANGESPVSLEYAEIIDGNYRFMKAQAVAEVCLACHGKSIPEQVKKRLSERYPADVATGYELGQIRGAISVVKAL